MFRGFRFILVIMICVNKILGIGVEMIGKVFFDLVVDYVLSLL